MQCGWWLPQNTRLWGKGVGGLGRGQSGSLGWKEVWMLEWKGLLWGQGVWGANPRGWKTWGDPRTELLGGCWNRLLGPYRVDIGLWPWEAGLGRSRAEVWPWCWEARDGGLDTIYRGGCRPDPQD